MIKRVAYEKLVGNKARQVAISNAVRGVFGS